MGPRSRYWSCSKFANWLRGTAKPHAETGGGWSRWHELAKSSHPIRYWLAEEGLDHIQNVVNWIPDRLHDIRYYVNNRWVTKSHALTAHPRDIKPGDWQDLGYRFLPCMMNELVDFVEIELAWHNCMWDKKAREKYDMPWWRRWYRQWRSEPAGMDYLEWAKNLTDEEWLDEDKKHLAQPTSQALTAREIEIIYRWWKYERPNRPDPYDASGWTALCERRRTAGKDLLDFEDRTEEDRQDSSAALDRLRELEEEYEREDEEMMIRLIKIRRSLWT